MKRQATIVEVRRCFKFADIGSDTPFLEWKGPNERINRLYIICGVSEDTAFGWQTKNEIWVWYFCSNV